MNPVTPSSIQATIPSTTGSICAKLKSLWSLANKMYQFWVYAFTDSGEITPEFANLFSSYLSPTGSVIAWPIATSIPDGYLVCNGQTVSRAAYPNLFARVGTTFGVGDGTSTFGVPDYRDAFLRGASSSSPVGASAGAATKTLTVGQLPSHRHFVVADVNTGSFNDPTAAKSIAKRYTGGSDNNYQLTEVSGSTEATVGLSSAIGSGEAVDIMNPYKAVHWLIKT